MKHLFFIGNKRCGTTLMVNLLNLHPNIFISHESDVMRVLWWIHRAVSDPPRYAWDGKLGVSITLKECAHILKDCHERPVPDVFRQVTGYLMEHGSEIQRTYDKTDLQVVGDKKPVQYCDPKFRSFIRRHFPGAQYLHMVRDPRACVASKVAAAKRAIDAGDTRGLPIYWRATPENILGTWVAHELWALQMVKDCLVHRIRLEDLCRDPVPCVFGIFDFIGCTALSGGVVQRLADEIREMVYLHIDPNHKYMPYDLGLTPEALDIAIEYGYPT